MVVMACVIVYSAVTMFRKAYALSPGRPDGESGAGKEDGSPASEFPPAPVPTGGQLLAGVCIGLIAGAVAGYAGVGGGFIIVPLVIQLVHVPMRLTSGTSLIAVMILAVPGVVYQALLGNVHWIAGIAIACGSIPGAIIGSRLVTRISERALRLVFGVFLLVVACVLLLNQIGTMG